MHLASFKVHQVDSVFQSFRAGEKGYYVTVRNGKFGFWIEPVPQSVTYC